MLFDDALGFISFGNTNPEIFTKDNQNCPDLTSVKEGFLRGNMYESEYKPYKNMTYSKIIPKTKREELLLEIMELCFAINDLNLYLDLHAENKEILKKFHELVEKLCTKEMEYVKKFGPLELIDNESLEKFKWIEEPWPWQNEGGAKYV